MPELIHELFFPRLAVQRAVDKDTRLYQTGFARQSFLADSGINQIQHLSGAGGEIGDFVDGAGGLAAAAGRVNVPADFDTKRKAFSGSKAPKKA